MTEPVISKRYALANVCTEERKKRIEEWFGDRAYLGIHEAVGRLFTGKLSFSARIEGGMAWLRDHGLLNGDWSPTGKSLVYCPKPGEMVEDIQEYNELRRLYPNAVMESKMNFPFRVLSWAPEGGGVHPCFKTPPLYPAAADFYSTPREFTAEEKREFSKIYDRLKADNRLSAVEERLDAIEKRLDVWGSPTRLHQLESAMAEFHQRLLNLEAKCPKLKP